MYKNNVYIDNYKELSAITQDVEQTDGTIKTQKAPLDTQFKIFEERHNLPHDERARAQYRHWRATVTGVPELLRPADKQMLGL